MTSLYNTSLDNLHKYKERRKRGDVVSIPWSLPRLSTILPGVEQGRYYLISAMPKGGKTALGDFLFLLQPIEWYYEHREETDITLKIFYFSLEVSAESKMYSIMSYKLYKDGIYISPQKLRSVFSDYILEDSIEAILKSDRYVQWFSFFKDIVTIYDDIRSPYGIFNTVRSYAEMPQNGSYTYKTVSWKNEDGTYSTRRIRDRYIPARPNEYVLVVVDHLSLLGHRSGETLHNAISTFSSKYCLEMRDRWNYSPVIIQQQAAESSKAIYDYRGRLIINKIKPDKEGLADNKYTSRDLDLMISLFYPYDYNIEEYEDIDLTKLGRNHRELIVNLNRYNISNAAIQLFFAGFAPYFEEMPEIVDEGYYEKVRNILKNEK